MTSTGTKKTPVAVLGGLRDEGLENIHTKEMKMNSPIVSSAVPTRIQLEPNVILDVDPVGESHVEVTVTAVDRSTIGIGLSITEARKFASALLDASAPTFGSSPIAEIEEHVEIARKIPVEIPVSELAAGTVTDLFRFARDHDMRPSEVMPAVEEHIDGMAEAESLTPAQWCKRRRQQAKTNR